MTKQRLHSNLAEIDLLTREEMAAELQRNTQDMLRIRYEGQELQRAPFTPIVATAATMQLFTSNDATPWGPEQGDIWRVFRVIVKSSVLTDTAKYTVYRGSTPSDVANAYSWRFLFDAFIGGATPGQNVNVGIYNSRLAFLQPGEQIYAQITGATVNNIYAIDFDAMRVPAVMKGKIMLWLK